MNFRTDINGLRAIAVLAVMLYHFGLFGFEGGFTGVDIFFVISGFLMTGIVLTGMQKGDFSFRQFYASRCRRILPALTVLCIVLLCFGWFFLGSVDYKMLGRHAASSLIFISNFIFKNESGYFDSFSKDKYLLHTWSLSVEWQFYLVYPLLLALITGWFRKRRLLKADTFQSVWIWLITLAIASYIISAIITPTKSAFAFYLLPARFWELLAGGIVYLALMCFPLERLYSVLSYYTGITLIIASIIVFSSNTIWPGYAAAMPVLGSVLVIWANRQNAFILNHPFMQKIGVWSYSIYLWHWPIMVVFRHLGVEYNFYADMLGIVISVMFGAFSYIFIETPFRKGIFLRSFKPHLRFSFSCGMVVAVIVLGFIVDKRKGFSSRVSTVVAQIETEVAASKHARPRTCNPEETFSYSAYECNIAMPDFIVLGDSHASSGFEGLEKAAGDKKNGWLYSMTCPPFPYAYLKAKDHSRYCHDFYQKTFNKIDALPADIPLFIIFRYAMYLHGPNEHPQIDLGMTFTDEKTAAKEAFEVSFERRLTETVCQTAKNGRPVYILAPVPEIGIDVPNTLARQIIFHGKTMPILLPFEDYIRRQKTVLRMLNNASKKCGNIQILDPVPYLCPNGICQAVESGLPLYTDDNHLGRLGNMRLIPLYAQALKKHLHNDRY